MNSYEYYATGHYLSDWPERLNFNEIIRLLNSGDPDGLIWPCEFYEDYPKNDLADLIEEMRNSLEKIFNVKDVNE